MKQNLNPWKLILAAAGLLLFLLVVGACGSDVNMEAQISGKWKPIKENGIVDINLAKDPKSLIIDGRTYKAVVEDVDKGSSTMHVKVETDSGKSEVWIIRQIWDDNGSTFKLAFRRNGTTKTLVPAERS
jgi:hypothetical protein